MPRQLISCLRAVRRCSTFALLLALLLPHLTGCGGGSASGSGGGGSSSTPDFALSLSYPSLTIAAGQTQSLNLNVFSAGSAAFSTVTLSVSGAPAGVTITPSTSTLSAAGLSSLSVTASSSAAPVSNVPITITGTNGTVTHTAVFSITVTGPPSFSLAVSPASLTLHSGQSGTITLTETPINGFNGSVSVAASALPAGFTFSSPLNFTLYGSATITVTASSTASTSGTVTFTGTSGTLSSSAQLSLATNLNPDFALNSDIYTSAAIYAGTTSTLHISSTVYSGFASPIQITLSGLPAGVTAAPATFTLQPGATQTVVLSASLSAPSTSNGSIAVQGVAGSLSHNITISLLVLTPALAIQTSLPSLSIPAGSSASDVVNILGNLGSTAPVNIAITGLPSGITASPATLSYQYGSGAGLPTIYFMAAPSATGVTGAATITATYGPYTATTSITLKVIAAQQTTSIPLHSALNYVRTDANGDYGGYPAPLYTVYHAATNRFFSSDAGLGRISAIDASLQKLVGTIPVPGAFGIDLAPDGSVLYVGTTSGDLYTVDPVQLTVLKRYPSNTISPYGYTANAVFALASGKLLLMRYFLVGGYSFVDGNGPLAIWNPADNSILKFVPATQQDGLMPERNTCFSTFEFGRLTSGRTRFLMTPVLTSTGSSILCSLDPDTGAFVYTNTLSSASESSLSTIAISPDGNTIATFDGTTVYVLDPITLSVRTQFLVSASQSLFQYPSMIIGTDNKTLYITGVKSGAFVYAYDLTSGTMLGWLPGMQIPSLEGTSSPPSTPILQAISGTGLIAGVMDQGVGLLDSTMVRTSSPGYPFGTSILNNTYGPMGGGTQTSWSTNQFSVSANLMLGSVYFGTNAASDTSISQSTNSIFATSPAGTAGPVDLVTLTTDGGEEYLPQAFTYGPWVLESPTSYSTAEGGGPASVFGYGFGTPVVTNLAAPIIAPPSNLSVTVGGKSATVSGYIPSAYVAQGTTASSFPLNGVEFNLPPGNAGTSADVVLTNGSGSNTVSNAITYLPATQQFTASGSSLADGIYDSHRQLYYFSDATQIRVFSAVSKQWQTPIPVAGAIRLWGMALSPDGSKLAVADLSKYVIDVLDASTHAILYAYASGGITEAPVGVAVTNSGKVYGYLSDDDGDGSWSLMKGDPQAGVSYFTPYNGGGPQNSSPFDHYGRLPMSSDGTRVFFNAEGEAGYIDTQNDTLVVNSQVAPLYLTNDEMVVSAGQTRLYFDYVSGDSQLDVRGIASLNYRENVDANWLYGAAMSPDGELIFQPATQSIDILDGNTGAFRGRVSLPFPLSTTYRALVSDGTDDLLVAITASGDTIALVDLRPISEPPPIPYLQVTSSHPSTTSGSTVAITPLTPAMRQAIQRSRNARGTGRHLITTPENTTPYAH